MAQTHVFTITSAFWSFDDKKITFRGQPPKIIVWREQAF